MNHLRRKKLLVFTWLVALAVVLRSFIAPGFMLSVSAENGLNIIFCNGPSGIYTQHNPASGHQHHHDENAPEENHISPACSFWSTSSLFVVTPGFEPGSVILAQLKEPAPYQSFLLQQFFDTARVIRAPPPHS